MTFNVFLEYLSENIAIARGGPLAYKWGDPFELACVIVFHKEEKEAEIKGLTAGGELKREHARALFRLLMGLGYTPYWERVKGNEIRPVHGHDDPEVRKDLEGL